MIPANLTLESWTEGDRWAGIPLLRVRVNGVAPASAISTAVMRFKRADDVLPNEVIELSAANEKLTILSAADWEIRVPPQVVTGLTAGKWKFQIRIGAADGSLDTFVSDEVEILEKV